MTPSICVKSHRELRFDFPTMEQFTWEDIAFGLAGHMRFGAQLPLRINIAAHSLFVSAKLQSLGYDPFTQLVGLLHDAEEAFTGDLPAPLKAMFPDWKPKIQIPLMNVIWEKLLYYLGHGDTNGMYQPEEGSGYFAGYLTGRTTRIAVKRSTGRDSEWTSWFNECPVIKQMDLHSRECERLLAKFTPSWLPAKEKVVESPQILEILLLDMAEAEKAWLARFYFLTRKLNPRLPAGDMKSDTSQIRSASGSR